MRTTATPGIGPGSAGTPPDEDWQQLALCPQTDPEAFFPERGKSADPARAICLRCPVLLRCLQQALDDGERFGVFGALSAAQRRRLNRALLDGDRATLVKLGAVAGGADLSGLAPNRDVAVLPEVHREAESVVVVEDRIAG